MRDYKVKTIRALDRGLEVLTYLQDARSASLHELYLATDLPKATLTRIILTLEQRGLVWQRLADGAYMASHRIQPRLPELNDTDHVVEVASPILERLGRQVQWPSILAVPRLDHMAVVETNTSQSYFSHILQGQLNFRINMPRSATGRAYLAFCSDAEREAVLQRLRSSKEPGNFIARKAEVIEQLLNETRRLGYGERAGDFGGDFNESRRESDDGRLSIAVPVMASGDVIAVLNLTWNRKVKTTEEVVKAHLSELTAAAHEISTNLMAT